MTDKINKYSNFIFRISLLLVIVFISSDLFLSIEISEATIRFSYMVFFVVFIFWIFYFFLTKNFIIPYDRSYIPLLFFCFISFISSLNSVFPLKSLIYALWTVFSALTILFLVWYSHKNRLSNLDWILKIYFYSFFVITIFGLYQFLLPFLFGKKTPFVMQWWQDTHRFARINGLSYEPSYFATYLLMGCFIWFILWKRKSDIVNYKGIILISIMLIIFLSSSRLGWLGIALVIAYGLMESLGDSLINKRLTRQNVKFFTAFILIALFAGIVILLIIYNKDTFRFLFKGTGLFNTADFSVEIRNTRTLQTFAVFLDNPINFIFGVGPGGVGAYMAANPENFNIATVSFEQLWATEPSNLFAEILASVGIIGFAFFAWFIINISRRLWGLYKSSNLIKKYRTVCLALFCGLIIELVILQFNQNYLRPYLWLHIGISIATINVLEYMLKNNESPAYILNEKS